MNTDHSLIIGAGIAGLTCALSLAQKGLKSTILEAFDAPSDIGAGIQISPNAWRILEALGLSDRLIKSAVLPQSIRLGDAHSGKIVLDMPVNREGDNDKKFAAIHRAKLHTLLWDAATASKLIDIKTGQRLDEIRQTDHGVQAVCENGTYHGRMIIGADGIWSNTRRFIRGVKLPKATGRFALRAIVPSLAMNAEPNVTAWMAKKSHIVAYPIQGSGSINIVAILNGPAHSQRWDEKWDGPLPRDLQNKLAKITPTPSSDIAFTRWPLFSVKPDGVWHSDNICLIGDAAHGMEPFAAQGAAMAIEDGFELAFFITRNQTAEPRAIFDAFYRWRVKRVRQVAKRTALNRTAYHQTGLGRWGRNFLFAAQPSDKFLQSLNWLYGYKAKGL